MRKFVVALAAVAAGVLAFKPVDAIAQDKVKVGVFPISSSLPFYVALDRGFFKEQGIEPEVSRLMGGPSNVAALITNQIEVAAVLVTLEGLNANMKKPGVALYIAMHSQNTEHRMEQFVARKGLEIKSLADFKGKKLMTSPGPANFNTAKAVLAKAGLKEGEYTIDQLDQGQHVNVMQSGTFDGGYTLEPSATIMEQMGVARVVEAGLIAKYVLGDPKSHAYAAGCALSTDFINARPDVARRFAAGWAKAVEFIKSDPAAARKHLAKNTLTPENLVDVVPMLGYTMIKDMTPKQRQDLQTFADFGVQIGVVPEKIAIEKFTKVF